MKRNDIIALVIVLLIIFGIIIWVACESEDQKNEEQGSNQAETNFFKRIADRIDKMQRDVSAEFEKLRLTTEMQAYLERKVNWILLFSKLSIGVLAFGILGVLLYNGVDVWTSILAFCGVICLILPVATFFFFTKCMSVQELVDWIVLKIKQSIFKKYGCDPATIAAIEKTVAVKNGVIKSLRDELSGQQ
jgi:Flp pilus assembly protein TadB